MNNESRKQIGNSNSLLQKLRSSIEQVAGDLETIKEDEQSKLDGLPENLQESETATKMQEAIDCIEQALANLDNVDTELDECDQNLSTII